MNRKERKTIKKSVQTIQDIGDKNLGSKIKKNWKNSFLKK